MGGLYACGSSDNESTTTQQTDSLPTDTAHVVLADSLTPETTTDTDTIAAPAFTEYDYIAEYLSGMLRDTLSSPLAHLSQHEAWLNYAQRSNTAWQKMHASRLDSVSAWREKTIKPLQSQQPSTVFYPFSGPDFLHAFTFFPEAERYLLIGLEPVGAKPSLAQLEADSNYHYLQQTSQALSTIIRGGYFITFDMREHFKPEKLNGVLPLLYIFLARTGQRIQSVNFVGIQADGQYITLPDGNAQEGVKTYGVEIEFWNTASKKLSKLVYFSQDMANWKYKEANGLYVYLNNNLNTQKTVTYLKSASYLMHQNGFSNIRQTVFDKSSLILQDDTGIAYRFFDKNTWDIHLYGGYGIPIPPFTYLFEQDLDSAYRNQTPSPLPFTLGYQWGKKGRTSMLCAVRI